MKMPAAMNDSKRLDDHDGLVNFPMRTKWHTK
jgi:hypothetical protein